MIEHLEIIEIDLPVITGTCTYKGGQGYGTPLTCDEAWTGEYKTYRFCKPNALVLPGYLEVMRCVDSISETVPEIKPGNGLGSRGSLSVTFNDIKGDANRYAPGVTDAVIKQGTYFGKGASRQILINKNVRILSYEINNGLFDYDDTYSVRHYIGEALTPSKNKWSFKAKDELSRVDIGEKVWPATEEGFLRQDIDDEATSLTFEVDDKTEYKVGDILRIGDELIKVDSVSDILGSNPTVSTLTRGTWITNSDMTWNTLNTKSSHSAGDEVFVCFFADNMRIDDLLAKILTDIDTPAEVIPLAEWAAEVDRWHTNTVINFIYNEAEDVNDVIARLLTDYLIDIVFDVNERLIKLFAISVWQESKGVLTEGAEITQNSVNIKNSEDLRSTRALVVYDKPRIIDNDDTQNYKKGAKYEDSRLQSVEYFGEHKDKLFDNSPILSTPSAELLVQRWVSRFGINPKFVTCEVAEAKLNNNLGDVVDYRVLQDQGADGLPSTNARGQIVSIKPKYKGGRTYQLKLASYEAVAQSGSEYILTAVSQINLYTQAGNPPDAVNVTFIIDTSRTSSNDNNIPSIYAGNFVDGSKITLIFINGSQGQSKGGNGGRGQGGIYVAENGGEWELIPAAVGDDGGVVYDANGVETDIFLSGATPSANYPIADGYIFAPAGGDGGNAGFFPNNTPFGAYGGDGGRGGDGSQVGFGGAGGEVLNANGDDGASGQLDGTGSGWGVDGVSGFTQGGLAGKGIITGGGVVTVYGDFARFINGRGDSVEPGVPLENLTTEGGEILTTEDNETLTKDQ